MDDEEKHDGQEKADRQKATVNQEKKKSIFFLF